MTARKGLPTIYDVARECGVATSTVSRALSQPGRVSARTSERVHDAAARLGYVANPLARPIPTLRSRTVVLAMSDVANPVFAPIIKGAGEAAARDGFTLVLTDVDESAERERAMLESLIPGVAGIALATSRMSDAAIRTLARRCPMVTMNRVTQQVPSVVQDYEQGMRSIVEHLASRGHRRLTYVAGPPTSWADAARWQALKIPAESAGVRFRRLGPHHPSVAGGEDAAAELCDGSLPTAVVAYNDLMAIGLMKGLRAAGYGVPDDVSVVGFDNILGCDWCVPPLTTLAAPLRELGSAGMRHLLAMIGGADAGTARPMVLPTRLIVRESTARPPWRRE